MATKVILLIVWVYGIRMMDIKEFPEQHKLSNYWDKSGETGNDYLE